MPSVVKILAKMQENPHGIAYDLCAAREDAAPFVVLGVWRDDAAIESHNASAHFTTPVPRMVDLSAEPPSVVQYVEA